MPDFETNAPRYHAAARVQAELAAWGAEWLEPDLRGKRAVEFGAGTGLFTQRLATAGANLLATDLSPAMIREGARNVPEPRWLTLDARRPDHPDLSPRSFDRLYSSAFLQWATEPEQILTRWGDLLRPGGRILSLLFLRGTLTELEETSPGVTSLQWLSAEEWTEAHSRARLRVLRAEEDERTFTFPDAAALLDHLRSIGTAQKNLLGPGKLRRLLREYDQRFAAPGGGDVRSTWRFFRIEAVGPSE